ncbi:Alpha/beta hydrolase fold protein OS=Tsukamurella paurometabola (strain ATCC 8368 / DSM / CCUG 35730 / CIP 100753 / JCM 10117 / KCTC 9821 / NBRC 16120 /NCIMB 702349 / NCTC 13040) OX=521096 GN=Tpau_3521 PE=4 SV=1 [Tsukamurella paurometabola]|uniref:Alpha/beta hydrolase fold protein n=1 Tax=Tsukamurella paurometabola (strain ATCC 8368 / DSM 20162 / CCUG 35730 / CIP 100753 / JCM 10117 / KCTC 9821 / NBRC 16120 / NCIMB 702349 / NCTC 13040) TaxID=521096 RepID=D5UX81_TSUPD|nr:alpha/beta hydrolase [Tsukamurella paurometabola]ADG80100.1 alpha/beta hydrolase fold protein [Tsukamurella paurometabola DSM 20162]SUP38419.1 Putative non-heme bromoperoxidase BpoC [Tsukamurella paurometabola]
MQTLHLTGVDLAVDRRGPADAPAVLLIAGGGQSMDWWTPEFCDQLRGADLQVIRYDHRDCGGSSSSPPGHPEYTGDDLAADPLRILDALEIERAHVVGMSMGGGIAQALAVRAPQRLASVTLVESSPAGGAPGPLPPPLPVVAVTFTEPPPAVDWSDEAAVIDYRVDVERPYAAVGRFDEARVREIATREVRRTRTMESSMNNHFLASPAGDTDPSSIAQPALVIHSADDPMFPLPHGEALAAMIPGARLLRLDGVGHEVPPPSVWSEVIPAIRELVADAS